MQPIKYLLVLLMITQELSASCANSISIENSNHVEIHQLCIDGLSSEDIETIIQAPKARIKYLEQRLKESLSKYEKFALERALKEANDKLVESTVKLQALSLQLKAFSGDDKIVGKIKEKLKKEGIDATLSYLEQLNSTLETHLEKSLRHAKIFLLQAKLYEIKGRESKTEESYRASLRINQNFDNLLAYSNFLSQKESIQKALSIIKSIQLNELELSEYQSLKFFNNLARLYQQNGQIKEAEENYQKAWESLQLLDGNHPLEKANILNNLGNLYLKEKKFDNAKKYYQRAISTLEQNKIPKALSYPTLANSFNALGSLYRQTKETNSSQHCYQKALSLYLNPKDLGSIADTLHNLANLYYQEKEPQKAIDYYLKTFEHYKKLISKNPHHYRRKILSLWQKIVRIAPLPPYQKELAKSYQNMGWVYLTERKFKRSIALFMEAQKIYDQKKINDYENLSGLAYNHYKIKKYEKASIYYQRTLKIELKSYGDFLNYYESSLLSKREIDKNLNQQFVLKFKDKKEIFIYYEMFLLFDNLLHHQKIEIKKWQKSYQKIPFKFDLLPLKRWIKLDIEEQSLQEEMMRIWHILKHKGET